MKIIFMGTPDFAVKPLESLLSSARHKVVAVVTQPDKPVGRKGVLTPPPVKTVAEKSGVPVYQFPKIGEGFETLKGLNADIMITCAYGQLIPQSVIMLCPYGIVNIHASLLPKYRGAAPIQYAVINGEKETGVTFMKTDVGLDTGDMIAKYPLTIKNGETAGELSDRLSSLGAEKAEEVLNSIEEGTAVFEKQDNAIASLVKTIKKEDSIIDFTKDSETVCHFVLGMNPKPAAQCFHNGKIMKVFYAVPAEGKGEPGEVLTAKGKLIVACGKGAIEITELQEEGGKRMSAKDFLSGRKIAVGERLISCL